MNIPKYNIYIIFGNASSLERLLKSQVNLWNRTISRVYVSFLNPLHFKLEF